MKKLTFWMTFLTGLGACAWAAVERPLLGYVLDARGALRPVEGIAGAFVVGATDGEASAYVPDVALTLEHREAGIYVLDADGGVAGILPPEARCALLLPRGVVYASSEEVVMGDLKLPLAGVRALRAVSAEFVQVSTDDGEYLLRIEHGREALFRLPAIPVEVVE